MKPELKFTKDLSVFERNSANPSTRTADPALRNSIRERGFLPGAPMMCTPGSKRGHYLIIDGHRRLDAAEKEQVGVWFVVSNGATSSIDIAEFNAIQKKWSLRDYIHRYKEANVPAYIALEEWATRFTLPLGLAVTLLRKGATSARREVMAGTFKVTNLNHANECANIMHCARRGNYRFWNQTRFALAISDVIAAGANTLQLGRKLETSVERMQSRATREDYIAEIERVYNYRLPAEEKIYFTAECKKKTKAQ